jgi:hypothetical protein
MFLTINSAARFTIGSFVSIVVSSFLSLEPRGPLAVGYGGKANIEHLDDFRRWLFPSLANTSWPLGFSS